MDKIAGTTILFLFLNGADFLAYAQEASITLSSRGEALRLLSNELSPGSLDGEPIKCGFTLLVAGRQQMQTLPADVQSEVRLLASRPVMQTSILRNGFRVHFDTSGTDAPALLNTQGQRIAGTAYAFAESTASILAYVQGVEIGTLGYPIPIGDGTLGGGPELDVYIMELGSTYGMTNVDNDIAAGGRSSAYITIDNDFAFVTPAANRGIPALKVTLAHEFHHVVQIGSYGLWPDDVYFYEITSTWLEDVVYTDVNDYYNSLRTEYSQFKTPSVAFTSNQMVQYSRAIWGHFIAKVYGTAMMRRSWEFVRDRRPLEAIDAALRERGSSFELAFSEWTLWNYYTGSRADIVNFYPEGTYYPEVVQVLRDFVGPLTTIASSVDPTGARYHQVFIPRTPPQTDTLTIVISNVNLAGALAIAPLPEDYECILADSNIDTSYMPTGSGIFVKFSAANPSTWSIRFIVNGVLTSVSSTIAIGSLVSPTTLELFQNYPNPFNPSTIIRYGLPYTSVVQLTVFNTLGQQVATLVTGEMEAGYHEAKLDASGLSSGVYLYRLQAGNYAATRKLLLVK